MKKLLKDLEWMDAVVAVFLFFSIVAFFGTMLGVGS